VAAVLTAAKRFDPQVTCIGAWKPDGLQLGVSYTYDEEGEVTGTEGTPTHPANTALLVEAMPDLRDNNGNVLPRPTVPYQAHGFMGWRPRVY
jgi:hypothetical protein